MPIFLAYRWFDRGLLSFSWFFVFSSASAQKWDSTYRPGNYEQRVANFKSYPNSKKDIIFLGNIKNYSLENYNIGVLKLIIEQLGGQAHPHDK